MKPFNLQTPGNARNIVLAENASRLEEIAHELSPEFYALTENLTAPQVGFLLAYAETASTHRAEEISGTSRQMSYYWRKHRDRFPDYGKAWDMIQDLALQKFEDILTDRIENGLREEVLRVKKEDGEVVRDEHGEPVFEPHLLKIRQDPNLLKTKLQALDPSRYGNRDRSPPNVNVEVVFRRE